MPYPTQSHATRPTESDVIHFETDTNYCREHADIAAAGEDLDLPVGTLLTGGDTPEAFDDAAPATVTGVLLTDVRIEAGRTLPVAWAARGPATLLRTGLRLPATPANANAAEADLAALGFKIVDGV